MFNLRKKLLYISQKRGCKETDLILGEFAKKYILEMSDIDLKIYEQILQISDNDLYDYLVGKALVPEYLKSDIMSRLINFTIKNK